MSSYLSINKLQESTGSASGVRLGGLEAVLEHSLGVVSDYFSQVILEKLFHVELLYVQFELRIIVP